ncbi:LppU/SCO3897 family protein [Actinacidiphila glaucinigra]|uniref:LppU/SCO3897 family protein n=1 Tax=Actinacidiphila glaucinigra TaxID=235986 RepID=UPI003D919F40
MDVDCSSGDAQFKIVKKFDDSTDQKQCESVTESDVHYTQSGTDFNNVVLCLQSITK